MLTNSLLASAPKSTPEFKCHWSKLLRWKWQDLLTIMWFVLMAMFYSNLFVSLKFLKKKNVTKVELPRCCVNLKTWSDTNIMIYCYIIAHKVGVRGLGGWTPPCLRKFHLNIMLSFKLFLPPVKPKCREWYLRKPKIASCMHVWGHAQLDKTAPSGLVIAP